jgi:hypothetical protein
MSEKTFSIDYIELHKRWWKRKKIEKGEEKKGRGRTWFRIFLCRAIVSMFFKTFTSNTTKFSFTRSGGD